MIGTPSSRRGDPGSSGRPWMRFVRWGIAAIVIVGLALAIRNGVSQWRGEIEKLRQAMASVEDELGVATEPDRRETLAAELRRLRRGLPTAANIGWGTIGTAAVIYALALLPSAMLLRQAIRTLEVPVRLRTAIAAQLVGHLGKYAPGKAMVVVLRVMALGRDGATAIPATVAVFIETLLMMAVGATISGLVIRWLPVPGWMVWGVAAGAVLASLPTLPPVLRIVTARVTGWGKVFRSVDRSGVSAHRQAWALFVSGWFWSLLSWALIGAAFALVLAAMPASRPLPPPHHLYAVSLAAISLAMVVGFVSLLPGGVGARELVLITILAPAVGDGPALLAAIAARLMFLVVESVVGGAAWYWLRHRRH